MNLGNFFAELKRRNVYKVAVAYAVIAWLLIQAGSILFPTFEAPGWVMKAFISAIALGFPVALILAWAFELTPEGVKRTEEVPRGQSIARSTGRKLDFAIIGVLALAVALLVFDRFRPKSQTHPSGIADKSIAVLPFENLSRDPDNAYFATGVQDEILTRLAKVSELKVISRTSTQRYQSKPGNLREIAQELGVAHILEGSVQRAADSVRVNVQLIKADTDAHLWAETYDRKLAEIFQVQSDIALQVASALEAKLTGREKREIGTVGTTNQQAYEAYLRGLVLDTSQSWEETEESLASFRRAVELDPDFALAWAALANRESFRYFSNRTPDQLGRARHAMEMALKLQPEASESYAAAGSFYYYCPQDFERALANLAEARERAPNNAFVIMLTGAVKRRQGKLDENIELLRQAGTLDPRNNDIWVNLARSYRGAQKFAEAHKMFDQALSISPRDPAILGEKAETYLAAGDLESVERLLQPPPLELKNEAFGTYVDVFVLRRDFARAIELLAEAQKREASEDEIEDARLNTAYLQQLAGKSDEAKPVFEEARRRFEDLRAKGNESWWLRHELIRLAAVLGDRPGVERESEALLQVTTKDRWHIGLSEASAARGFAVLGDPDRAIPHIERALALPAQQGLTPAYLRLDPVWDKIRNDPRFQKVAETK
jgi:TolB-like protein/Flp pilus assembly protein TadD